MKCCVYVMHGKFSGSFRDYTIFIFKFATDERFLYKLETFKNCKEVKHIMIMIIAVIYIFLCYVIFDEQLKINFKRSSDTPKKIHSLLFTHSPPKTSKIASPPPIFVNIENFLESPCRQGWRGATDRKSSSNTVKSNSVNQSKVCSKFQRCIQNPVENIIFCSLSCKKSSNVDV